jgi:lipoprotein signal peptidase
VKLGQRRIPSLSLLIAAVVVGLDQLSKHWAVSQLNDGHTVHVLWTLQFNLAFNGGMAFGRGQGLGPIIGVIATIVVVVLVLSLRRSDGNLSIVAVGLIVGGAMGNIVDRLPVVSDIQHCRHLRQCWRGTACFELLVLPTESRQCLRSSLKKYLIP